MASSEHAEESTAHIGAQSLSQGWFTISRKFLRKLQLIDL